MSRVKAWICFPSCHKSLQEMVCYWLARMVYLEWLSEHWNKPHLSCGWSSTKLLHSLSTLTNTNPHIGSRFKEIITDCLIMHVFFFFFLAGVFYLFFINAFNFQDGGDHDSAQISFFLLSMNFHAFLGKIVECFPTAFSTVWHSEFFFS